MNQTDVIFVSIAILLAATANPAGRFFCCIIAAEFIVTAFIHLPDPYHFAVIAFKDSIFIVLIVLYKSKFHINYARIALAAILISQLTNGAVFCEYYSDGFFFYDAHYPIMFSVCVLLLIVMASNGITRDIIGRIWVSLAGRSPVYSLGRSYRKQP